MFFIEKKGTKKQMINYLQNGPGPGATAVLFEDGKYDPERA